jgi:hypothetical protein
MTLRFLRFGALTLAVTAAACDATITDPDTDEVGGPSPGSGGLSSVAAGSPGAVPTNTPQGGSPGSPGASGGATSSVPPVAVPPGLPADVESKLNLSGSPKHYRVVRLTNEQWTNSAQRVLGLTSPPTVAETFQDAVSGTTAFNNNELVLDIDSRRWTDYQAAAEKLAAEVTADPALLSKVYPGNDGAGFITTVGRRVYRRPLTTAEAASYQQLFDLGPMQSGTQSAFAKGASLVLEAMLQSPHFLYRTELGAAGAPLSGFEMAAKLSLLLRNTTPDDALLDAAATPGNLDAADGAAAAAQKMLDEPVAKSVMREFHSQFLHFDRFSELSKVGVATYDPAINAELIESSFLFFDRIFSQGLGVKDVFLSTTAFVGPRLAPLYEGGAAAPGSGFVERTLGTSRAGYFLQLPFLMLNAHNADPDPIHRGVTMSLDVLCAPLGQPADEVPQLPAAKPGETNRQRVDAHTKGCGASCHNQMINPLGFAFENFDGMGQYRQTEKNGSEMLPIDSSGSFAFVDGTQAFKDAAELMKTMANSQQAHLCYAKKLASFSLQRDVVAADLPLMAELSSTSLSEGASLKQVMVKLIKQDAFRVRAGGVQ